MRKIALGLFIGFLLLLASIPSCASAPVLQREPVVCFAVQNNAVTSLEVYVTDGTGLVVTHRRAPPMFKTYLNVPRAWFHTPEAAVAVPYPSGKFYSSAFMDITRYNLVHVTLEPYPQFSTAEPTTGTGL